MWSKCNITVIKALNSFALHPEISTGKANIAKLAQPEG